MRLLLLCFSISAFSFSAFPQWLETHQMIGKRAFAAPGGSGSSITKTFDVAKQGAAGGCTTSAIDSSGSSAIVISVHFYSGEPTLSDSKGNTWQGRTAVGSSGTGVKIYYCLSPTVGSGHTFTLSGGDGTQYLGVQVLGFSGITAYDTESAGALVGNISVPSGGGQPGSATPSAANSVCVSAISYQQGGATVSIDSGFTKLNAGSVEGGTTDDLIAYKIKSSATAENPTYTADLGVAAGMAMAVFK